MKSLKVYYAKAPNMGDRLNKMIIEKLFGYKVEQHTFLTGELSGIGSGLGQFTLRENKMIALAERISGLLFPNVTIWGTGFICYKEQDSKFYRKNIKFAAVRGELSRKRVEKILGRQLAIPTGDAGILANYLLQNEKIQKKYEVGIIAHFREQDEVVFKQLIEHYDGSVFIDLCQDPLSVIRQIAECKTVISSSLHGLIVADSFHIPNIHIIVSNKLMGDGFKFDDYYSAYGLKHKFLKMGTDNFPELAWIKQHYALTAKMIEKKKEDLINAFPFPHQFEYKNTMV